MSNTQYLSHELSQVQADALFQSEQSTLSPESYILDRLYYLAFRSGLGNPLFASPIQIQSASLEKLKEFKLSGLSRANAALVGLGVSHKELTQAEIELFEEQWKTMKNNNASPLSLTNSKYYGGEAMIEATSEANHYSIAYPCPSLVDSDLPIAIVLKELLGTGAICLKYGSGLSILDRLSSPASSSKAFSSINSDAGLFGIHTKAPIGTPLEPLLSSVLREFYSLIKKTLSSEDLAAAKEKAKFSILAQDNRSSLIENMARQLMANGTYTTPKKFSSNVDKVSAADIKKLVEKMVTNKPSVVGYGSLAVLPAFESLQIQ